MSNIWWNLRFIICISFMDNLLLVIQCRRILINNINLSLKLFSTCDLTLLLLDDFELGEVKVPLSLKSEKFYKRSKAKQSFYKSDMRCIANFMLFSYPVSQIRMIQQIHSSFLEERKFPTESIFPEKSTCPSLPHLAYYGRHDSIYFVFVGPNEAVSHQNGLMSELMRLEYPNHFFYWTLKDSTEQDIKSVYEGSVLYLCLRCPPPFVKGSSFEFDFWKWKQILIPQNFTGIESLTNAHEKQIAMIFWWDYYHIRYWIKYGSLLVEMSPRKVLNHLMNRGWVLLASDILFSQALGLNGTLEHPRSYSFYRQRDKDCLQDIHINGAAYLTQSGDALGFGIVGIWKNNFKVVYAPGDNFKFVTCSSTSPYSNIMFGFYFNPFQQAVWILIIVVILVQIVLLFVSVDSETLRQSWKYLLWYFSLSLLEVFPRTPQPLKDHKAFTILFFQWGLICVLLSNGYKGILTNYMIAPLDYSVPKTWNELPHIKGFKLIMAEGEIPAVLEPYDQYGVSSPPHTRLQKDIIVGLKERADLIVSRKALSKKLAMDKAFMDDKWGNLYGSLGLSIVRGFDYSKIENQISQCDKSIFIETVEIFESYVKKAFPRRSTKVNKYFTVSSDTYIGKVGWIAGSSFGNSRVLWRLKRLVESGIFGMWKQIMEYGNRVKRHNIDLTSEFHPQSLLSNIITIFIIYSALSILTFSVFLIELSYFKVKRNVKKYLAIN